MSNPTTAFGEISLKYEPYLISFVQEWADVIIAGGVNEDTPDQHNDCGADFFQSIDPIIINV